MMYAEGLLSRAGRHMSAVLATDPRRMRALAALIAAFSLGVIAEPAQAQPVKTGHLEAQLVAQNQGATPGSTITVALRTE